MNKIKVLAAIALAGQMAFAAAPTVSNVTAKQRYPWNGKVDITYTVSGDLTEALPTWAQSVKLVVVATNRERGTRYESDPSALSGDTGSTEGAHHVVWDLNAQGLEFKSGNVEFSVEYKMVPKPYCVIDLSSGSNATSYPVTYLTAVPSGGWTDEYKTTKLVLRFIDSLVFYMGVFEVTQKQYELVTGSKPSYFSGDTLPVEQVSWKDIHRWDSSFSYSHGIDVDASTFIGKIRARTGITFDLPTVSQWEYACRSGSTTTYYWGDSIGDNYCWYNGNSSNTTHPVGAKTPNAWGLYDMSGNVWEWCLDSHWIWVDDGSGNSYTHPEDPDLVYMKLCGGSYNDDLTRCASSFWTYADWRNGSSTFGFRLVGPMSDAERESYLSPLCSGASSSVAIDSRTGVRRNYFTSETLTFSSLWDGDASATVTITQNGVALVAGLVGEGERTWSVQEAGTYTLTHTTYRKGVAVKAEEAVFEVMTLQEEALREAFSGVGTLAQTSEGWKVTLTNNAQAVRMPDNLGSVVLDLRGYNISGRSGGNAVEIYAVTDEGTATHLKIIDSNPDDGADIIGGNGDDSTTVYEYDYDEFGNEYPINEYERDAGHGGSGVSVAGGVREGVRISIGGQVTVKGGAGGSAMYANGGNGGSGVSGNVATNDGFVFGGSGGSSDGCEGTGGSGIDGMVQTNNGTIEGGPSGSGWNGNPSGSGVTGSVDVNNGTIKGGSSLVGIFGGKGGNGVGGSVLLNCGRIEGGASASCDAFAGAGGVGVVGDVITNTGFVIGGSGGSGSYGGSDGGSGVGGSVQVNSGTIKGGPGGACAPDGVSEYWGGAGGFGVVGNVTTNNGFVLGGVGAEGVEAGAGGGGIGGSVQRNEGVIGGGICITSDGAHVADGYGGNGVNGNVAMNIGVIVGATGGAGTGKGVVGEVDDNRGFIYDGNVYPFPDIKQPYTGDEQMATISNGAPYYVVQSERAINVGTYSFTAGLVDTNCFWWCKDDGSITTENLIGSWSIVASEDYAAISGIFGDIGEISTDGAGGWKVTITNDIDSADLPIDIPDNLGHVTIDLNGYDLVGGDGSAGDGLTPGGDGRPAICIVPGTGDGDATRLSLVTTGGDSLVKGGDGGDGNPGGNGAPAIDVADGVKSGVKVDVGAGVTVRGGDGGNSTTGRGGDGGAGIDGNVGTNDGTIIGGNGGDSVSGDGGDGGAGVDGNVDVNNGSITGGDGGASETGNGGDGGMGVTGDVGTNNGTIAGGAGGDSTQGENGNDGIAVGGTIGGGTGTIRKVKVPVPEVPSAAYTGTVLTPEVPASGLYAVSASGGTRPGSYSVMLTLLDTANYEWEPRDGATIRGALAVVNFVIIEPPLRIEAAADDVAATYDGRGYGISVSVAWPLSGATVRYARSASGPFAAEKPLFTNATDAAETWYEVSAPGFDPVTNVARVTVAPRSLANAVLGSLRFEVVGGVRTPVPSLVDDLGHGVPSADYAFAWNGEANGAMTLSFTGRGNYLGTFTARLAKTRFHVTFDANGGELDAEDGADYDIGAYYGVLPVPTRAGYLFDGWYERADFSGEPVTRNTEVIAQDLTLHAKWFRRKLWYTDATFHLESAAQYNGYLVNSAAGDVVAGTIQVKAGRPNKSTGASTLTVSVLLAGEKKATLKVSTFDGVVTGTLGGRALNLALGFSSMSGTLGPYVIDGSRDVFTAKDADSQLLAAQALKKWQGVYTVAWKGAAGWNGLSIEVKAKGKAKVAGTLADGTKVSASSLLLVGERECALAVSWTKKASSVACLMWFREDGTVECGNLPGGASALIANLRTGATLAAGAAFRIDPAAMAASVPGLQADLLPDGLEVRMNGTSFEVDKPGKVQLLQDKSGIDPSALGGNPSGFKLKYTVKNGTFKGAFNAYVLSGGKLTKVKVSVSGVVLGGRGYGTAEVKKVASWPITIE